MRVTAELSLYPLEPDYVPRIQAAVRNLQTAPGIDVVVNQMSTQICGDVDKVMAAIDLLVRREFADGAPQALVIKVLNADLPIRERPEV